MIDIVCDDIMMGCKRHYMKDVTTDKPENDTPIKGTKHSDLYETRECHGSY